MIPLADMVVADVTALPPPKLLKALAVIAEHLHPLFDGLDWLAPGKSKESCVLCSLTVCDFLQALGLDARPTSVCTVIRAREGHSVGIGVPHDTRVLADRWAGHLVVNCERWLIDTTLYQAERPQWKGSLPGMMAVQRRRTYHRFMDLSAIAGVEMIDSACEPALSVVWFHKPTSEWRRGPDAQPWRHHQVAAGLLARFGEWKREDENVNAGI